jgi:hypothetical protein
MKYVAAMSGRSRMRVAEGERAARRAIAVSCGGWRPLGASYHGLDMAAGKGFCGRLRRTRNRLQCVWANVFSKAKILFETQTIVSR